MLVNKSEQKYKSVCYYWIEISIRIDTFYRCYDNIVKNIIDKRIKTK